MNAWDDVVAQSQRSGRVDVLAAAELDAVVDEVTSRFVADATSPWWWRSLRAPATVVDYGSDDGIEAIEQRVPADVPVVLLVSDEQAKPSGAVRGLLGDVVAVIRECIMFEFVLVAADFRWAIFDTHHNRLLVAGELAG